MARPLPLLDDMLGYYRPALFVLLGAVGCCCHRVPERRQPAAGARHGASARDRRPCGASARPARACCDRCSSRACCLALAGTAAGAFGALALLKIVLASMPVDSPAPVARPSWICVCSRRDSRSSRHRHPLRAAAGASCLSRTQASERSKDGIADRDRRARAPLEPRARRD
jgi:hypothetical protein